MSLYPRSDLQDGEDLVRASVPLNQLFTQVSQPKIFLQHFVTITGGLIGTALQMLHWNVSLIIRRRAIVEGQLSST